MILFEDHNESDLDQIALDHFNKLNVLKADGITFRSNALITRIENRRTLDISNNERTLVRFWDYLLDDNYRILRQLITGRPGELNSLIVDISDRFGNTTFSIEADYNNAELTGSGNVVKSVFNYQGFRTNDNCRELYSDLNLSMCPYCNEQTIQTIQVMSRQTGETKRLMLLQLDHFYPQSRHPYLALSFFNLIPGCANCNSFLKRDKRFSINTHFNPYHKRLEDYFSFQLDSIIINSKDDIQISYINKSAHLDDALVDFEVIERYGNNVHKRMIFNLVNSVKNHSSRIRRSLRKQFFDLFEDNETIKTRLIETNNVPQKQSEINEVQLGKLKRDILIQLEIINP